MLWTLLDTSRPDTKRSKIEKNEELGSEGKVVETLDPKIIETWRYYARATQYMISETPHNSSLKLCVTWRKNLGKCVDASPLVVSYQGAGMTDKEIVFIGSHSKKFVAIECATGTTLWETVLGDRVER
jgi:hypothetical protein